MAWADNSQVGLFVQRVCRAALDKACSCSAFAGLIVRKPGGGTCLMVDQGKHAAGQLPRASLLPWLGAVTWGRPPSRQGRRLRGALLGSVALGSLLLPSLLDPSRQVLSQPLPAGMTCALLGRALVQVCTRATERSACYCPASLARRRAWRPRGAGATAT